MKGPYLKIKHNNTTYEKILIIEDDKAMASILQESLQEEGFGATLLKMGEEGA